MKVQQTPWRTNVLEISILNLVKVCDADLRGDCKNNAWVEELKPYSDYVLIVKEDCVIYV